jgi:hypothetical protein
LTDVDLIFDRWPSELLLLRNFETRPPGDALALERANDRERSACFVDSRLPRETTGEAAARLISNPF